MNRSVLCRHSCSSRLIKQRFMWLQLMEEEDETALHEIVSDYLDELTLAALQEDLEMDINGLVEMAPSDRPIGFIGWNEGESGNTCLHRAVKENKEAVVDVLLSKNVNIEIRNTVGDTPLMVAVECGSEVLVKKLIEKGSNIETEDESFNTPLLLAVSLNLEPIVNLLLKKGASCSVENESNQTPLYVAVKMNYESVFDKLVEAGADVNFAKSCYGTPIESALTAVNLRMAEKLLANGAALDSLSVFSSLLSCCKKNFVILFDFILEKGFDINAIGRENCSLLHIVVTVPNVTALEILLKKGANVNAADNIGQTPLHYAAMVSNSLIVKLLLEHKSDVNIEDIDGDTPLNLAVRYFREDNVRLLLNAGANMNIPCNSERSALNLSLKYRTFSRKTLSYMLCARKMGLAKLCVNLTQNDGTFPKNFTTLFAFESKCLEELNQMKLKKFGDTISLFNIFSEYNNPVFASNSNMEVYVKSTTLKSDFPLYASLMRRNFIEGIKRNILLDDLIFSLSVRVTKGLNVTQIVLPNEASRKILVCLENCDLLNVKRAFDIKLP